MQIESKIVFNLMRITSMQEKKIRWILSMNIGYCWMWCISDITMLSNSHIFSSFHFITSSRLWWYYNRSTDRLIFRIIFTYRQTDLFLIVHTLLLTVRTADRLYESFHLCHTIMCEIDIFYNGIFVWWWLRYWLRYRFLISIDIRSEK